MFHPSEVGGDLDMQREGSRGQAKRSFLSDVVSFLSRIFNFLNTSTFDKQTCPTELVTVFRATKSFEGRFRAKLTLPIHSYV